MRFVRAVVCMKPTLAILALTFALLMVPASHAHTGHAAATAPPLGECAGTVDVLCFHWDCNQSFCIHLFCPVYIGGSHGSGSFGCTPH